MIARCFAFAIVAISCAYWPCLDKPLDLSPIASGQATYYAPGIFPEVLETRRLPVRQGEVIGFVALLDCDRIGQRVWLLWPDGDMDGPYLVADCANAAHRAELVARGWAVDVDAQTARRQGMLGPVEVKVYKGEP